MMSAFERMLNLWYSRHTHLRVYRSMYVYTAQYMWIHDTDFEEENKTITLTVPTQGSIPVISIQNWIVWMNHVVASGFNWSLPWNNYKNGFGSSDSEDFWLGLERLHLMTTSGNYRLRIEWQEAVTHYWLSTEYWLFWIEDEVANYVLHVDGHIPGDDGRAMWVRNSFHVSCIMLNALAIKIEEEYITKTERHKNWQTACTITWH